jgi:broad specificity phosphatase PhoE
MAILLLVKHSLPAVRPELQSTQWKLSQEGTRRCHWLAAKLREHGVTILYSSLEAKALETASILSAQLSVEFHARPDLYENDRTGFPFLPREEWEQRFREFFDHPDHVCIGTESAAAAALRFSRAVKDMLDQAEGKTPAIVSHGTVITLFTAQYNLLSPFDLWRNLSLPSFIRVNSESFECEGIHNYDG